jgi:hypothetical protein
MQLVDSTLMLQVESTSQMSHKQETDQEQHHEEKVLSDHGALLVSFPITEVRIGLFAYERCDEGNSSA